MRATGIIGSACRGGSASVGDWDLIRAASLCTRRISSRNKIARRVGRKRGKMGMCRLSQIGRSATRTRRPALLEHRARRRPGRGLRRPAGSSAVGRSMSATRGVAATTIDCLGATTVFGIHAIAHHLVGPTPTRVAGETVKPVKPVKPKRRGESDPYGLATTWYSSRLR